jgi:hypothetical protein
MRTTNKFDSEGKEIFEGDRVLYAWGYFSWKGKPRVRYQIHTIKVKKAYLQLNGQMRDDGNGVVFLLGETYNNWCGEEVVKLTNKEVIKIGIEDDTDFFFDKNKAIIFTDQHFMGLSNSDWQKELERRRKLGANFLFGWKDEL